MYTPNIFPPADTNNDQILNASDSLSNSLPPPTPIKGLSALISEIDCFIFDIWGVIHNGERLFPHVVSVFTKLRQLNKGVFILSNAPSRLRNSIIKLEQMGLKRELYDAIFTSGEHAYESLKNRSTAFHEKLGKKVYSIGAYNLIDELDYEEVATLEEADFILASTYNFKQLEYLFSYFKKTNIYKPLICANYDRVARVGNTNFQCSGEFARLYEEAGGPIFYHGKPLPALFDRLFSIIEGKRALNKKRTLMIGDSLETDIMGGKKAGIRTLLLTTGILSHLSSDELLKEYTYKKCQPDYIAEELYW